MLNGFTQFYLPPTRFIPARAEQDLEHYIRNELVNVANYFTDLGRKEAWDKLSAREWSWTSTVHDWTCIWVGALTNWASQADICLHTCAPFRTPDNESNADHIQNIAWHTVPLKFTQHTKSLCDKSVSSGNKFNWIFTIWFSEYIWYKGWCQGSPTHYIIVPDVLIS